MGGTDHGMAGGPSAAEIARLDALVGRLVTIEAEKARLAACEHDVYAEAMALAETQRARIPSADSAGRDMPVRAVAAELATAIRASDRTTQARMNSSSRLAADFPATLGALHAGRVSPGHARAILETGMPLDEPGARAAFERAVLARAETLGVGRTRAFAQRLAERINPRSMAERHRAARQERRVWVTDGEDGMATLGLIAPTPLVHGIYDRVTQQAKAVRDAAAADGDGARDRDRDRRTLDQIRADVVTDLLLTGAPTIDPVGDRSAGGLGAIRAVVQVTIPVTVLSGTSGSGAELDGRSPVDPGSARRFAGDAPGWDRVLTDPVTGTVLAVDRYTPSAEQRRLLRARDQHCRFPGCRTPARRCDLDHTHDHAKGGRTEIGNLACFCRRHHTLKHATGWHVRQQAGGVLEWTSPIGRVYVDEPPPRVAFTPDGDPPPF